MCGVFGIYAPGLSREQIREQLYLGVAQLDHRGPDAWGCYFSDGMALGHTRLSIFDLADGHQPMITESSALVYNGEVYNHYELRRELERDGVVFHSKCDTEVIQKLYEKEGPSCLAKLNGQFAIILWDKRNQALFLARDRLGMRPLYVLERNGALYFSSEMKAFDAIFPGERAIDPARLLDHALLWNTLGRDTIYRNISTVASGTYECYQGGRLTERKRYYEIGEQTRDGVSTLSFDEAMEAFKSKLDESVQLRLRSDVPVGAYLSGGIDSTVISSLVKQHKQDLFKTFSVEFEQAQFDESRYQRLVSEAIQSQHHPVSISSETLSENFLNTIYHCERPIFRTAPIPMLQLSKKVRETDIKVVLTGEGADEILFGYDTFKELKILERWSQGEGAAEIDSAISNLYPHLNHYADPKQFGLIKMYYEGFLNSFGNNFVGLNIRMNNNKIIQNYLNKDWGLKSDPADLGSRLDATLPNNFTDWSLLQKNSFLEIKTLLQGYLLSSQGDRMALGNSVEGRYPFLDHNLIEFVFSLPDEYKLQGFTEKHLLKQAFAEQIPQDIIDRPKRPYMAPDIAAFYRGGELVEVAEELLNPAKVAEYGCFDEKMVTRFLRKFKNGVPDHVGYRDNMIFTFLMSTQACQYWIHHPRQQPLDLDKCTVEVFEYH
ncbi:MAG: asparagine synthase (glutamine-hydrolyzing) [Pseudomonadota bacterium]|nr:asparagine synthase (glutamine-hydrolyzing) [Pseudomonadota bacterium]